MRLATRLQSGSLIRCQRETGARQFIKWKKFFQDEDIAEAERVEKWEHYAARISSLLTASMGQKVSEKDMLIPFKVELKGAPVQERKVTKEERIAEAKSFWGAFFAVHGTESKPGALKSEVKKKGKR